jgi:mannose-6-phosphate isomerase-like protein (cupin superfamily)
MKENRVVNLNDLPLEQVRAHGGDGEILFHRPFASAAFEGPVNFVDYAVLPPGASIGRHTHGDNEEVYLVLEGRGTMHLDDEEFRVAPGSVILNRRGGSHALKNDGDEPLRLFVVEVAVGAASGAKNAP